MSAVVQEWLALAVVGAVLVIALIRRHGRKRNAAGPSCPGCDGCAAPPPRTGPDETVVPFPPRRRIPGKNTS